MALSHLLLSSSYKSMCLCLIYSVLTFSHRVIELGCHISFVSLTKYIECTFFFNRVYLACCFSCNVIHGLLYNILQQCFTIEWFTNIHPYIEYIELYSWMVNNHNRLSCIVLLHYDSGSFEVMKTKLLDIYI